jgi:hypothetical protein
MPCTKCRAGPPFLTDDTEPTEKGHWEIYAPLIEAEGKGTDFEGAAGVEINYGPTTDLQITLGLPVDYTHDTTSCEASTRFGVGGICQLKGPFRLLALAGPTFEDDNKAAGFDSFLAPGMDFYGERYERAIGKRNAVKGSSSYAWVLDHKDFGHHARRNRRR